MKTSGRKGSYCYPITRELFSWYFKPDTTYSINGAPPAKGSKNVLLVSNHTSFIDAWLLSSVLSHHRISWCTKVQIHESDFYHSLLLVYERRLAGVVGRYVAKQVVRLATLVAIHVMNHCDTIIVDPENPSNPINRSLLSSAREKLQQGKWLGIFPEGGITSIRGEAKLSGMVALSQRLKLNVHQIYVNHSQKEITFYQPLHHSVMLSHLSLIESRLYSDSS
jgi:1-acyl-sn-glycerol-3-phosphate acyltransferase